MDKERVISRRKAGDRVVDIAESEGVSRVTVYKVLKEAGLTRTQIKEAKILRGFVPPVEHRTGYGYEMLMAYEAWENELPVAPGAQEALAKFKRGLKHYVWTYDEEDGIIKRKRKPRHGNKPFVKDA